MVPGLVAWTVVDFLFDWALLWATAQLRATPVPPGRLAAAAWTGAILFALLPDRSGPLVTATAAVAVSVVMAALAFQPRAPRSLVAITGTVWAVAFVAAGAGLAAQSIAGLPGRPACAGAAVSMAALWATARWGHRRLSTLGVERSLRVTVRVRFGDRWMLAEGFVDTGNRLKEPVTGLPVILVGPEVMAAAVGDDGWWTETIARDAWALAQRLPSIAPGWAKRFRLVPFEGVGIRHGVLAAFRADEARLERPAQPPVEVGPTVVAVSPAPLRSGEVQALVPPEILAAARAARDPVVQARMPDEGGMVGVKVGA
ncbi:sigma-E processing peptidase SpoIIGA [Carboxydochorda subterranea]|uniref:Sigma-E processing peptidase SpoIIGA n=1 Tax=Carboxydichorda subterranea TaxID=3109565 RepID=A0ABZ1C0I4_9FIRM|nr:sigma-E processing peptidase SpoIIGA [Limnochorda sp. L945t]WRP18611.1 sigma-E processing peptidase SpoIIGA [Limnochorda sp. L945t]